MVRYDDVAAAVAVTGMVARGGFVPADQLDHLPDGREVRAVIVIGNIGGGLWAQFRLAEVGGPNPLDAWTRSVLEPIAVSFGAEFVHPSDEPFQPFQRWAQRADDVWPSPIGLLIHSDHGLWHAYRGAFLFADEVADLPTVGHHTSPCLDCDGQPCLTTCPVDAFAVGTYDADRCASHVASLDEPACLAAGCAARLACPVGVDRRYGPDQMRFHMDAFVGARLP